MKYGINLYRESLIPKQDWLSLPRLLVALVVVISILVIWRGMLAFGEFRTQSAIAKQTEEQQQLQQQLGQLTSQVAGQRPDRDLERNVAQLERDLERQQQLLHRLRSGGGVQQHDYAQLYFDLPQIHVDGVWLTRIHQDAGELALYGKTTDAALLPRWMEAFNQVDSLGERRFAVVELQRDDRQVLNFTVQSRQRPQQVIDEPDEELDDQETTQ